MTGDERADWAAVDRILDGALDLDPADRAAFIACECGDDSHLRARVEKLLRAAAQSDRFMERPAHDVASGLVREMMDDGASPAAAPEYVGPYRIIGEIGRGGMGTVYLAERADDEFARRVAIKLVPVAAAPDLRARFLAERRILAGLDHPNIARLYDGGSTPDGVPYFVMEYIDGERIDVHCDRQRLSITRRLELFDTVCAAVEFAHQNMVVHRDLKPGNVLVTADGTVKLLDFGVAKLLDDAAADDLTRTGLGPMTPGYASPEQLRGEAVSTATDVYALGILLYELLTGQAPYDVSGRTPSEIERLVGERTPTRPSATVVATGSAAADVRDATPDALRRRLAGDLDTIVLTALRKEPRHRYASVHGLRDDLRRHREGRPISARAPTAAYVATRFMRRNRVAVGAAVMVVLSLVAGLVGTAWQARAAAREARRANEVRDFLVSLFESVDPDSTRGRNITAVELLERGAARLDSGLATEPLLRADMLGVVGRIYRELGLYGKARPLLEEALLVRQAGPDGAVPAGAVGSESDLVAVLLEQGEFEQAEQHARAVLEARSERARDEPAAHASALAALATILSQRGDVDGADSLFRAALAIDREVADTVALSGHLDRYGSALWRAARNDEALEHLEEALALRRGLYGNEHTLVATSLLNLSTVVTELGDYPRAEALLRECLRIRRKLLGDTHPHVAVAYSNLGSAFTRAGRLDEAEAAHRQAYETFRSALGERHPETANSLNHIGVTLYFQGRYREAAAIFERVLELWREAYGPQHRNVFAVLNNLGAARRQAGDLDGAEEVLRNTLALRREAFGEEHADVAQSLNNLGVLLVMREGYDEAEPIFREAIGIWQRTLGATHPAVADGLAELGRLLLLQERWAEAEPVLRETTEIRTSALDATAPLLASARLYWAESLLQLDRLPEADSLLALALPVLTDRWGEDGEPTLRARAALDELARLRGH